MEIKDLTNFKMENLAVLITINNSYLTDADDLKNKTKFYLNFCSFPIEDAGLIKKTGNSYVQNFYLEDTINTLLPKQFNVQDILWAHNFFLTTLGVARAETLGSEELYVPDSFFKNIIKLDFYKKLNILANEGTSEGTKIEIKPYESTQNTAFLPSFKKLENKSLILASGGTDNVVAAMMEKKLGKKIGFLQIMYQQAARYQEIWCVDKLKDDLQVDDFKRVNIDILKHYGGSALLKDDMQLKEGILNLEYVPFRNSIFISLGLIYASSHNYSAIVLGIQPDDTVAPDGTKVYVEKFNDFMNTFKFETPKISAPLLYFGGKPELIKLGLDLGVNFKHTWSCHTFVPESDIGYNAKACGTCGTCSTRFSAFKKLGLSDPVEYMKEPKIRTIWAGAQDKYDAFYSFLASSK